MTTCLFLGPSLSMTEAQRLAPLATCLPPAQQGSIAAAVHSYSPSAIGLIDGYFQHRPSVWHKEILWTLNQGIPVFGAASMGALRAAELEAYGMIGIGKIFKAYKESALPPFSSPAVGFSGDDEVAVVHGPAELNYVAVSDAMVNIRFTLDAALKQQIITADISATLTDIAKRLYFPERTYDRVLDHARKHGVNAKILDHLADWLPEGRIDQKGEDATALIRHLADPGIESRAATALSFHFETTEIWRDALPHMLSQETSGRSAAELNPRHVSALVDELRLDETAYAVVKKDAMIRRMLAEATLSDATPGQHHSGDATELRRLVDRFRQQHDLPDRESVDRWLQDNELDVTDVDALFQTELPFDQITYVVDTTDIEKLIVDQLRLNTTYPVYRRRARDKATAVQSSQVHALAPKLLWQWYFEQRQGVDVPADIGRYARGLGLIDTASLYALVSEEYRYLAHLAIDKSSDSGES